MPRNRDNTARLAREIAALPPELLGTFLEVFARPTYRAAITGDAITASALGLGCSSRTAALLLLSGGGTTLPETDRINLNARACLDTLRMATVPPFGDPPRTFVLVGLHFFTATVADGTAMLLSSSFDTRAVDAVGTNMMVVRADRQLVAEQQIDITVHAFGVDGEGAKQSVSYHWVSVVEIGIQLPVETGIDF
jgi:hypothetical protein